MKSLGTCYGERDESVKDTSYGSKLTSKFGKMDTGEDIGSFQGYRFSVIEPNDSVSISPVESRDAIIDENRFSSIPRPKDIIPNPVEFQRDDHSDDVPKAIDEEIGFIMENNTWVLSDLPPGSKPLGYRWIFKRKMKVDETIDKFKARLKIIKKFNHEDWSSMRTPMDPVENLKPNTGKPMDQLEYSRAIGCLMYDMTSTRPDIAYAVGRLTRFTSNPSRQH
ncbi:hypothetical protein Tco_1005142 [Tanacetum coccineum]|uniref:Reverse transcriptase Ty1/copia-type domain-containing protein n=1 Tax=Tanacetum coccineum TaxID=301880 RepID=A0ABQ5FF39_9ASTR